MSSPIERGLTCTPLLTSRASTGHLTRRLVVVTKNGWAGPPVQAGSAGSNEAPAVLPTGLSADNRSDLRLPRPASVDRKPLYVAQPMLILPGHENRR